MSLTIKPDERRTSPRFEPAIATVCRIAPQGDRPKPALTRAFSEDETSSLFATMGFWQGIDVPGRSLSLVAIDKLPFSRPDEPLLIARRERAGPKAFETIDLPRASENEAKP